MRINNRISKFIAVVLSISIILCGCTYTGENSSSTEQSKIEETIMDSSETTDDGKVYHLDDASDLEEYTNLVYENIVDNIQSDEIFVEGVQVAYYSDEYIQDVLYNSKESVFFGYTLSELDNQFQGTKYAFTLGDDGTTQVHEFQNYDFTTEEIIRNVAIGTAVIVVCVVVTIATAGAASEATVPCVVVVVNNIASFATKAAITTAVSGAVIGGLSAGLITGFETQDMNAAIKAAALQASKDYMWGAIIGAATGGFTEIAGLKWATGGKLTVKEAAFIQKQSKLPSSMIRRLSSFEQYKELVELEKKGGLAVSTVLKLSKETKFPVEIVKAFRSTEEGLIYSKEAGLIAKEVNGKLALVRDIDLNYTSKLAGKTVTNLERMQAGYAPIDPLTGQAYQLHHIGQKIDSPLAILTQAEHTGGGHNSILHDPNIENGQGVHALLSAEEWAAQREEFWIGFAKTVKP